MEKSLFFNVTFYLYLLTTLCYLFVFFKKNRIVQLVSTCFLVLGIITHTIFIIQRWILAGFPPFTNTFETLVLFSWLLAFQYFLVEVICKNKILGFASCLLAFIILAYSSFFPSVIRPLMPALQNNFWLLIHVNLCFISYAAFTLGFLCALCYLLRSKTLHQSLGLYIISLLASSLLIAIISIYLHKTGKILLEKNLATIIQIAFICIILAGVLWLIMIGYKILSKKKDVANFDNQDALALYLYRLLGIGFTFLTMGILTGAFWANEAWGTYWGWDPKETWSLITWLVYAIGFIMIYPERNITEEKYGIRLSWLSVLGFFCVLFTYFGVNYLLRGLHSYS